MEKANAIAPAHAQIHRNYLLVAQGKRFVRADKGSIKRRFTVELFREEIDRFYQDREDEYAEDALLNLDVSSLESITTGIRQLVSRLLGIPIDRISPDQDLFGAGLDSLQVFLVIGAFRSVVRQQPDSKNRDHALKPSMIYSNHTVEKLSRAFHQFLLSDGQDRVAKAMSDSLSSSQDLGPANALLENYVATLPTVRESPKGSIPADTGLHVVLTGSTGSLGSYLLAELLEQPHVGTITCLNRSADSSAKQKASNAKRGLVADFSEDKVHFHAADLSKARLGLSEDDFSDLLETADLIIRE